MRQGEPVMNERLRELLHQVVDGLGGGHQHLHATVEDAHAADNPAATDSETDHAEATGNDDASGGKPA